MKIKCINTAIILMTVLLFACSKEEGEGGSSSIQGKVQTMHYNQFSGALVDTSDASEQRVYIIYGDNVTHNDEVRTNHDGTFRFDYLRKGKYTLYTYSECYPCYEGQEAIIQEVEILKNGVVEQPDSVFIINKYHE